MKCQCLAGAVFEKLTYRNGKDHYRKTCSTCGFRGLVKRSRVPPGTVFLVGVPVPEKEKRLSDAFYASKEWGRLRYRVLAKHGRVCMCCGATAGQMHVDHVKPRSRFPKLALEFSNLQVLCRACNLGKGNSDATDFRPAPVLDAN